MTTYRIRYSPRAEDDLNRSFEWGVDYWGIDQAMMWLTEIEDLIERRLSELPMAQPVAPEDRDFDREIRQLIFGRYRVLFTVKFEEVLVLRVRGPFNSLEDDPDDVGLDR